MAFVIADKVSAKIARDFITYQSALVLKNMPFKHADVHVDATAEGNCTTEGCKYFNTITAVIVGYSRNSFDHIWNEFIELCIHDVAWMVDADVANLIQNDLGWRHRWEDFHWERFYPVRMCAECYRANV